ncbi:MAG: hypothetical protein ACR2LI_00195 [Propionibacteriaceae bacterium]
MHPTLLRVFAALEKSGHWLLLRGHDDLRCPTGDVDVLVGREVLAGLDGAMASCGLHRVVAPGHGSHRFYFRRDAEAGWIKLDVVSDLAFGALQQWRTPLARGVLRRRVRSESTGSESTCGVLWRPAPGDESWALLLHLVLDKGAVRDERAAAAAHAVGVATPTDPVGSHLDSWLGPGTAAAVLAAVASGSPAEVTAVRDRLGRAIGRRDRRVVPTSLGHRVLRRQSPTLGGRAATGLRVAAMGPDGSGKTTLLHGIRDDLPVTGVYVYMGLWAAGRWDERLHRLPGGRTVQRVGRLLRGSAATAYHRARGRIVLLDRVAYDAQLPGAVDTSLGGRLTSGLLRWLGPRPDVLFVLDAPGEVMFARKGEHSVEVLESWRRAYLELAAGLDQAYVLDATRPPAELRAQALDIVWTRYTRR